MKQFSREDFYKETSQIPGPDPKKEWEETKRRQALSEKEKPLGLLDSYMIRLAGLSSLEGPGLKPRTLFVFGSDGAVIQEGGLVDSLAPSTAEKLLDLAGGRGPISRLAQATDTQIIPVNLGSLGLDLSEEGIVHAPVMPQGARNFVHEEALTEETMMTAIRLGMEFAAQAASRGFKLLMAAGLSTSSQLSALAVLAALTGREVGEILDKGPQLDDEVFRRRTQVLSQALDQRQAQATNAFDVLVKLGSLDMAAMLGLYAGAAVYGIPVLLDDLLTLVAALVTVRLLPESRAFLFASQATDDPANELVLRELGMTPFLDRAAAYGGGTGALFMLPNLDLSVSLFDDQARGQATGDWN